MLVIDINQTTAFGVRDPTWFIFLHELIFSEMFEADVFLTDERLKIFLCCKTIPNVLICDWFFFINDGHSEKLP